MSIKYIKKVARFKQENYGNLKRNLVGKEDCGQMSAWYVFK